MVKEVQGAGFFLDNIHLLPSSSDELWELQLAFQTAKITPHCRQMTLWIISHLITCTQQGLCTTVLRCVAKKKSPNSYSTEREKVMHSGGAKTRPEKF